MTQIVEFFENDIVFKEGPFVISNPLGNGWRIEVEMKGHRCSVLPDLSIYKLKEQQFGLKGKTMDQSRAAHVCDQLNAMVREGHIVLVGRSWVTAVVLEGHFLQGRE